MSAYNEVNGTPAAASVQLIDDLARETFGFNGYFTSDCDAIYEIQAGHHWQPAERHGPAEPVRRGPRTRTPPVRTWTATPATTTSYSYGNTVPTALAAAHQDAQTDTYNIGDVDTSLVRLFTARIETGEFDAESRGARGSRRRAAALGGVTWVSSQSNNAITETPERLRRPSRALTRASSC